MIQCEAWESFQEFGDALPPLKTALRPELLPENGSARGKKGGKKLQLAADNDVGFERRCRNVMAETLCKQ